MAQLALKDFGDPDQGGCEVRLGADYARSGFAELRDPSETCAPEGVGAPAEKRRAADPGSPGRSGRRARRPVGGRPSAGSAIGPGGREARPRPRRSLVGRDKVRAQSKALYKTGRAASSVRRRLDLNESKQSRRADARRAFEAAVSAIREVDGRVPGYTRGWMDGQARVPSLELLRTAVELLTRRPGIAEHPDRGEMAPEGPARGTPGAAAGCFLRRPPSVLEQIPDSEREAMRADSARNLQLIRELGAGGIPTRAIVAPDRAESLARLNRE